MFGIAVTREVLEHIQGMATLMLLNTENIVVQKIGDELLTIESVDGGFKIMMTPYVESGIEAALRKTQGRQLRTFLGILSIRCEQLGRKLSKEFIPLEEGDFDECAAFMETACHLVNWVESEVSDDLGEDDEKQYDLLRRLP